MAGLVAVASAAGVVLLVSNPLQRDSGIQTVAATNAGGSASMASSAAPASAGTQVVASNSLNGDMLEADTKAAAGARQGPADHWSVSDPALEDELNGYLVEHNGLARGYGLSGTTPGFVRVATYGREATQ